MKITYDPEVDAMYIYLIEGRHECRTVRLNDDINLDFGDAETLVGIEILDASRVLGKGKLPRLMINDRAMEWPGPKTAMAKTARGNGGAQAKTRRQRKAV
jgi:uncharacterized protein YuzE